MQGAPKLRPCAAECAHRLLEIGRAVGAAAMIARITVLIGRAALGTNSLHEAVGQEDSRLGIEELRDVAFGDEVVLAQRTPDLGAIFAIALGVGTPIVVERDLKAGKVSTMRRIHVADELFFAAPLLTRANHD